MFKRGKRVVILLTILTALVGCSPAGETAQQPKATPTLFPTPIVPSKPTYVVQRGEVINTLDFTARVAPMIESELFFRTSGYVGEVYVERDEWVEEGEVLAELEVSDLKNQLRQAEAALSTAISNNEQRTAEAKAALQKAELNLAIIKANDPAPQLVIAEVALERAQIALQDAQEAYDEAWDEARDWELNVEWKRAALEAERESTERRLLQAELSLKVAQANYQKALQDQEVHSYNVQIHEQEVTLATMKLNRLETGLEIEEMRLNVERLQARLNEARLIAPFDGQVLRITTAEGRSVAGYNTVMIVADVSELELSAELDSDEMTDLEEGMVVTGVPIGRPGDEFDGQIRRLPYPYGGGGRVGSDSGEDEDQSTRITLAQPPEELGLTLDDRVRVTVVLERVEGVLWLPPQAIRTFEGRKFVVVQEGEGQRRVDISVGIKGEDRVEIEGVSDELTEGQVVIGQ